MKNEREDLRYEDDLVLIRFQQSPEHCILFPHIQLKKKLTKTNYMRLEIIVETAAVILQEMGIIELIANVPEQNQKFVQRLGFDHWNDGTMRRYL